MNYNDNCGDGSFTQPMMEVEVRKQLATEFAGKTYSTREECERFRTAASSNYSNSGCYIRITTSPCTGGNIGGGGIGGGDSQGSSLYSSTAIGEPYFAPNETYAVANTGRDLEIKLEALNKSYDNAVNGIRTGDYSFDEIYQRQLNEIPKADDGEIYNLHPRINKIYLEEENRFISDDDDLLIPIDLEKFKNLEQEAIWAKPFNNSFPKDDEGVVSALYDFASSSYNVGSGFLKDGLNKANDAVKYLETEYDIKVPYSEKIGELEEYLEQTDVGFRIAGKAFVGDIVGATMEFINIAEEKVINPLKDIAFSTTNTLANRYTHTKNLLTVGNPYKKETTRSANTILKGISHTAKTGDPSYLDKTMNKEISKYSREIPKWAENYLK